MKLNEALRIAGQGSEASALERLYLVCSFEPLHLPVFLRAHFAQRFPSQALTVGSGVFGDIEGNLQRAADSQASVVAMVLEWNALDSRLGARSTGNWSDGDILRDVSQRLARLRASIAGTSEGKPVAIAAPTLPLSLFGSGPTWQWDPTELSLHRVLADFLSDVAQLPRVSVLQPHWLDRASPTNQRSDVNGELATGFPYSLPHTSLLAEALVALAFPGAPKRGLITDLDDTLWAGVVGEVGIEEISWSQADGAQVHGLYQALLQQLADSGVLLAIATKNDRETIEQAFQRRDLRLDPGLLFPIQASWGAKSGAVAQILDAWNLSADSVVFVDDSPMELEEVRAVHPDLECLQFTPKDAAACFTLLETLRDRFGRSATTADDAVRAASIRANAAFEAPVGADARSAAQFITELQGVVEFDTGKDPDKLRPFELINKTNQFNLNGTRVRTADWLRQLAQPENFVHSVSYRDRFGALGTVGVIAGEIHDRRALVNHWVLSCRAFSRDIEFEMLAQLFENVDVVELRYAPTPKNRVLRETLERLGLLTAEDISPGEAPQQETIRTLTLSREAFVALSLPLAHSRHSHDPE